MRTMLAKHGAKQIADRLGLSVQRLYQWAEPAQPNGSGTPNPLDRVAALTAATGETRFIKWLCERAGGYFVQNPAAKPGTCEVSLRECCHDLIEKYADMVRILAITARDGRITTEEAEHLRQNWEGIKSQAEWYVKICESGRFLAKDSQDSSGP